MCYKRLQSLGVKVVRSGQIVLFQNPTYTLFGLSGREIKHSKGNRFAVDVFPRRHSLNCVAHRVTEVQYPAQSFFTGIGADHRLLHVKAQPYDVVDVGEQVF